MTNNENVMLESKYEIRMSNGPVTYQQRVNVTNFATNHRKLPISVITELSHAKRY